ncbi:MAG TPA: hypothetical protein VMF89_31885 [Polyangiales bacterium]|nr:hypothetical protein [Polyangiales bacterium]
MLRRLSLVLLIATCTISCARARRPDGPYRAAEEMTDALSDEAVACTRDHGARGTGLVSVAAEFTAEGQPPNIVDAGSSPGNEAVIACVRERAVAKLKSPAARPAPYVRVRVPLPVDTKNVKYVFMQKLEEGQ